MSSTMKAIAVVPGKPGSAHLTTLRKPSIDEVDGGRGVLVRVLRVGVDGTDKEINAAEYGAAPPGEDVLVIGHESFGVVAEVGPGVRDLAPGDFVRWVKQLLDLAEQIADAAGDSPLRETAREAVRAMRRGVVAYSSEVDA